MFNESGRVAARSISVAALGLCGAFSIVHAQEIAPTTPPGVTLVEVVRELGNSQPQFLWLRPGDAAGHTLFSYNADDAQNARCVDQCAREFPPLVAPRGARAFGDWNLVRRSDGRQQWAYQGKPLYTWSMEKNPGEVATNIGLLDTANVKLAESVAKPTALMPPEAWQVVRFLPKASMSLPDGIDVQMVYANEAVALTDFRGLTLYAYSGDVKSDGQVCTERGCRMTWLPVSAPALASRIGDFSVVSRVDGTTQWAYRGRPLYLYSGDELPGDALGASVDPKWAVAALTRNFRPPAVAVTRLEGYGDTFTVNGMTLYGGYAFGKRWGGRNFRDTFKDAYHKGKRLGAAACDTAECLRSWKPLKAAANAQSGGFWEPITRDDGTKQWAYKGFAMYTFAGDSAPGDHRGQAVYAFAKPEGDAAHIQRVAFYEEIGKAVAGAGIYWNIAKP
jgi:predicted lipoprotein with Yx(FWY)xxD motif